LQFLKIMKQTPKSDFDSPWKDIIEAFFPQFMEFFVPDSVKEIDWILNLPDKLEELFLQEISIYEKEKKCLM